MAHTSPGFTAAALSLSALIAIGCSDSKPQTARTPAPAPRAPVSLAGDTAAAPVAVATAGPASFADGESAYHAGNYTEAVRIFSKYSEEHPDNAWGHFMLGLSQWKNGDAVNAEASFNEALRLDPTHVKSLVNLARVLIEQGRSAEAVETLAKAGELAPDSGEVQRLLGRAYAARKQDEDAIAAYRKAIELDESDSWAMNNLGLILLEQGRPNDALPLFARAVELRKDVAVFQNNLGMALEHTGDFAAAKTFYAGALAVSSDYEKAKNNLARVELVKAEPKAPFDLAAVAKLATPASEAQPEEAEAAAVEEESAERVALP